MSAAMPAASALSAFAGNIRNTQAVTLGVKSASNGATKPSMACGGSFRLDVLEVVDADQAGHAVGRRQRGFDDDGAAHRMADQDGALQVQLPQNGGHVAAERLHRVGLALRRRKRRGRPDRWPPRGAWREVLHLGVPVAGVAAPAVHEDQRGCALSLVGEVDGDAVGGGGRVIGDADVAESGQDRRRD